MLAEMQPVERKALPMRLRTVEWHCRARGARAIRGVLHSHRKKIFADGPVRCLSTTRTTRSATLLPAAAHCIGGCFEPAVPWCSRVQCRGAQQEWTPSEPISMRCRPAPRWLDARPPKRLRADDSLAPVSGCAPASNRPRHGRVANYLGSRLAFLRMVVGGLGVENRHPLELAQTMSTDSVTDDSLLQASARLRSRAR
jgi:hypothetical protein